MLKEPEYELRNSSIRAKPANQARLDRGETRTRPSGACFENEDIVASTVVVLIARRRTAAPGLIGKSERPKSWESALSASIRGAEQRPTFPKR